MFGLEIEEIHKNLLEEQLELHKRPVLQVSVEDIFLEVRQTRIDPGIGICKKKEKKLALVINDGYSSKL